MMISALRLLRLGLHYSIALRENCLAYITLSSRHSAHTHMQVGTLYDLLDLTWDQYENFCVQYEKHKKQVSALVEAAMHAVVSRTDLFPHLKPAKEQLATLNAQLESEKADRRYSDNRVLAAKEMIKKYRERFGNVKGVNKWL